MNDDLCVVVTLVDISAYPGLHKVAVKVKSGLNTFTDWQYYHEPEINSQWVELLPSQFRVNYKIVIIEEISDIAVY